MKVDYVKHYIRGNSGTNYVSQFNSVKKTYDAELQQIMKYITNKDGEVIEIGSGYGYLTQYLFECGFRNITCVDFSQGLLDIIKSWVNPCPTLVLEDGLKYLESKNEKNVGLIIMYDLFEHFSLDDARKMVECVYNCLSDDGVLIIRTPNMANILGGYSRYIDMTHYHGYTSYSLTQVLEEGGFDAESINFWEPQFEKNSVDYKNKLKNDLIHKKLFEIQNRVLPSNFDKNLLCSAFKKTKNIISLKQEIKINKKVKFLGIKL